MFTTWSALRRLTMEQRQQAGRWIADRVSAEDSGQAQGEQVTDQERSAPERSIQLLPIPRYVSAVDHHCMPGSYHTELFPGDVSAGANYDRGRVHHHRRAARSNGRTAAGDAIVEWVKRERPDWISAQARSLMSAPPSARTVLPHRRRPFPNAEVIALDRRRAHAALRPGAGARRWASTTCASCRRMRRGSAAV